MTQVEREPDIETILDHLWNDYVSITPDAKTIHLALNERGERFRNDHIALRTYGIPGIDLGVLAEPFLSRGYEPSGDYVFEEKKLVARSFGHPSGAYPRVFVSELVVGDFPSWVGDVLQTLVGQVPAATRGIDLLMNQPTWPAVSVEMYERLLAVSEYAAWVAAFGIRANHFTVHVNDLQTFDSLAALNTFLRERGFQLNGTGSQIQGGPEVLLEQSSTVASRIPWSFAGGRVETIPTCYYEFAKRYPDPRTGTLYGGFVAASADKIFESTNVRR